MENSFNSKKFIFLSFAFLFLFFLISFTFFYLIEDYGKNSVGLVYNLSENKKGDFYDKVNDNTDIFVTRNPNIEDRILIPIIDGDDPVIGDKNASVNIVEFFDYDCDFCREQGNVLSEIINNEYNGQVKIVLKNFPISDKNSFSWKSAVASRCASVQDNFTHYHSLLLSTKEKFSDVLFLDLAKEINLDLETFKECYDKQETNGLIDKNIKEARDLNIPGIPFYYIGNQEIMGDLDIETLKKIIEVELSK